MHHAALTSIMSCAIMLQTKIGSSTRGHPTLHGVSPTSSRLKRQAASGAVGLNAIQAFEKRGRATG